MVWNKLPIDCEHDRSVDIFKTRIYKYLFMASYT